MLTRHASASRHDVLVARSILRLFPPTSRANTRAWRVDTVHPLLKVVFIPSSEGAMCTAAKVPTLGAHSVATREMVVRLRPPRDCVEVGVLNSRWAAYFLYVQRRRIILPLPPERMRPRQTDASSTTSTQSCYPSRQPSQRAQPSPARELCRSRTVEISG